MALASIDPFFLPWKQQGVDFLLSETPVPAELSLCHARVPHTQKAAQNNYPKELPRDQQAQHPVGQQIPPQANQYASPQTNVQANPQAQQYAGQQISTQAQRQGQQQSPYPQKQQGQQGLEAQYRPQGTQPTTQQLVTPQQTQRAQQSPSPILEELPPAWQTRLNASNANAVLWTYWSLGYDLCGHPSNARRALLKKIIVDDLQQTFKDYTFWPAALPSTEVPPTPDSLPELVPNAAAFWAGVHRLKARGLVIFGSAAAKAVGLQKEAKPAKFITYNGVRVLFTNDMDYLVENASYYHSMLVSLKPFLAPFRHW